MLHLRGPWQHICTRGLQRAKVGHQDKQPHRMLGEGGLSSGSAPGGLVERAGALGKALGSRDPGSRKTTNHRQGQQQRQQWSGQEVRRDGTYPLLSPRAAVSRCEIISILIG